MRWNYYKLRQLFLITKCDTVYYKLRQALQSAMNLLQIARGITKCDDYYKLRQYTEWGNPSSETHGQSVGSGERAWRKFSSTGQRAHGYRLSPNYFQKFKRMPAPDWAQKMLCIIVPNRRTVSPEFFSWVRTWRLLLQSRLVWLMHQRNARSQETFSLT